jgi:pteridine reductase
MSTLAHDPVALITGSALRLGAAISRKLHGQGFKLILHYHHSRTAAEKLCAELNQLRADSCINLQADLLDLAALEAMAAQACSHWGHLNVLVNNASSFYPSPLDEYTDAAWTDLLGTNARAPAFLSKAFYPALKKAGGCIVNISDIAASTGRREYGLYTMAKAALENLTRSLARELAPEVRVNGVAPGYILSPNESGSSPEESVPAPDPLSYACLNYSAKSEDIANAVAFLISDASYVTGQILHVDGGRKLKF